MDKSEKNGSSTSMLFIISAVAVGVILSAVYGLIKQKFDDVIFILLSSILSAFITYVIITQISIKKLVRSFSEALSHFKSGDFSKSIDSTNFDLLGGAASAINSVFSDIRSLIDSFFSLSIAIIQSSRKVSTASQQASASVEEISRTIDEIAKGASAQAAEAQHGVEMIDKLSEQINFVYESYSRITVETDKINGLNTAGIESVNTLRKKSQETYETSEKIFSVIEKLTNTIKDIGMFVESIENIAEQTNLLALNAAIEAARAGDAGKGFAVVAEEVRKLADQSRQSTDEINNLVQSIQEESQLAIQSMEGMKTVSQDQNIAVEKTGNSFNNIANAINSIVLKIDEVNQSVKKMQTDKSQVISAIENISSVSEQTAASSQEVAATTEAQLKGIEDMHIAAQSLDELVQELDKKLRKYKLQ